MKNKKRIIFGFAALVVFISTFSSSAFAEGNNISLGTESKVSVKTLINELNASTSGIPLDITREDIDRVINEGGTAGAKALQHIYDISIPVDNVLNNDPETYSEDGNIEHYSYSYDVSTGVSKYIDGSEYDYESHKKETKGESTGSIGNMNVPVSPMAYPDYWYESSPQSYDNTRSTCKLTIVTNSGSTYSGAGFLIANNYVGTAGHCLYDDDYGYDNWCSYVIVTPSSNGSSTPAPYGTRTSANHEVGGNWADHFQTDDDWGVIKLNSGFSIGYMGMWNTGTNIVNWGVRAQGWRSASNNMYLCRGNVSSVSGRIVNVSQSIYPGMSGGPLIEDGDKIIGFVRGYTYSGTNPGYGAGQIIRLDDWLFNKMTSYQ